MIRDVNFTCPSPLNTRAGAKSPDLGTSPSSNANAGVTGYTITCGLQSFNETSELQRLHSVLYPVRYSRKFYEALSHPGRLVLLVRDSAGRLCAEATARIEPMRPEFIALLGETDVTEESIGRHRWEEENTSEE